MLEICRDCPNSSRNVPSVDLYIGEAAVVIDPSGSYETFSLQTNEEGNMTASHLSVNQPPLDETYPELAQDIAECERPLRNWVRMNGVLGAMGLRKKASTCPALQAHMDVHDAKSVNEFFTTDDIDEPNTAEAQSQSSNKNRS